LSELFHDTLKDIYFAEKKILSALPKMAKAAQSEELKAAFAKIGISPRGTSPEEGAAFTRSEYEKWKKVIVEGKIKPE